jgi:hypothetical protein
MTKQKKAAKVQFAVLDEVETEEDLANNQDNLLWQLTESKREVRLSDESDYFNND